MGLGGFSVIRTIIGCVVFVALHMGCVVTATENVAQAYDADIATTVQEMDEETVETALDFIRNNEIDRGVFILQRLAGQGNAESLYHLGELFRLGIGRQKANDVATMYYRLATALGHRPAALALANFLFFDGDGSEKTIAEAVSVWQKLASDGDLESAYMLGMLYWNGEAGMKQDPVRGYGLVWRAAQNGYSDAVQNELTMRSLLNADAREAAMEYGKSVSSVGFDGEPLALDLLVASNDATTEDVSQADTELAPSEQLAPEEETAPVQQADEMENSSETQQVIEAPVDAEGWAAVWRLEVGVAMSKVRVTRLRNLINQTEIAGMDSLSSDVVPSVTKPGLFRLTYGPMNSMQQAVTTCVTLKRAGYECSAKAPEE